MPEERIYQPQVAPGATAELPSASPDAFGAGVGRAIEGLGGALEQRQRLEEQSQTLDAQAKYSTVMLDLAKREPEDKANSNPGGAGWAASREVLYDQAIAPILDGITDKRARARMAAQIAEQKRHFVADAQGYEAGRAAGKQADDAKTTIATLGATGDTRLRANPSATSFDAVLGDTLTSIDATTEGLSVYDPDQKSSFYGAATGEVAAKLFGTFAEVNPEEARKRLDSGHYDAMLGDRKQALDGKVAAQLERRQRQAEHQVALQKTAIADAGQLLAARVEAGEAIPDKEFDAQIAAARSIGDGSGAYKLQVAHEAARINVATEPYTPTQYREQIDQLTALGEKRTPAQDRALQQLQRIAPERIKNFTDDPGPWAALNGHPRPSFDPGDPHAIGALNAWATTVYRQTGVIPPPFAPDQAQQFRAIATTGTAQERTALAQSVMALAGPLAQKARAQIGGDANFQAALALGGRPESGLLISMALSGADAALPGVFKPALDEDKQPTSPAPHDLFASEIGGSLGWAPKGYADDLRTNIDNVYAYMAKRVGRTTFDPVAYQHAIRQVLGAEIGEWAGEKVILPRGMSVASFERRVGQATVTDWSVAALHGPAWMGTGPMGTAEARSGVPVKVTDGVYRLRFGNTFAKTKDKRFFEFDLAKLWDGPRLTAPRDRVPSNFETHPFAH